MRTEEGLLLLDETGKILWSNHMAGELLGFSREELARLALPLVGEQKVPNENVLTQRIRLTPPPVNRSTIANSTNSGPPVGPVTSAFRSIVDGQITEAEGDARIPNKEERRVAVHWRLWSLPGTPGNRQILFSFSETAQASEKGPITSSYRDVFEHAVEGIYRSTPDGQFIEVNPALARMCGYDSPAEMIACIRDLNTEYYLRPNRRAEFIKSIRVYGSVSGFESETFRADGSVFWTAEFARVVSDQEGLPLYFEGSVIDISKRKQAETSLRLSEEKFRSLVETTRVVPFEFHVATQCFAYIGPQAEAVFRCLLGSRLTLEQWISILEPDDFLEGTRFADSAFAKQPTDYQAEFRVRAPDGSVIWIKQIVHFDSADEDIGPVVRGFFFEVTEAKKLETERESSRVQLRELAARLEQVREDERMSIAGEIHDQVGQALTLLKIDLSWISARLGASMTEEIQMQLEKRIAGMEGKIESAFETVREILLTLRPPLLEELGLKDAIEYHLEGLARRVGFRYEVETATHTAFGISAKSAIFRIFQEILTNIVRHSRASRVRVNFHETAEELVMTVEDNGCGISEQDMRNPKKFGILGMKERALALGGKFELSGVYGKGTTAILRIPLERSVSREGVTNLSEPHQAEPFTKAVCQA